MSTQETFQIPIEAAEVYEQRFVPGLFAQWAPQLIDLSGVLPGDHVLDVACGTGIVARTAADRVGPAGSVVGIDLNDAMLTVARRVRPDIEFRQGDAARLPFDDATFDAVLCQMALMFFPDRAASVAEMARVVRPGGTVGLAVPAALDAQPAYRPFVEVAARHAGPEAMSLLGVYWSCGDLDVLTGLLASAGLGPVRSVTGTGVARFDSVDQLVATEVEGTPLIDRLRGDVYSRLRADARRVLASFTTPTGTVDAPFVCHLVAAPKP